MFIAVADLKLPFTCPENNPDRAQLIAEELFERFGLAGGQKNWNIETQNLKFLTFFVRFEAAPHTRQEQVAQFLADQGFTGFEINPPFR